MLLKITSKINTVIYLNSIRSTLLVITIFCVLCHVISWMKVKLMDPVLSRYEYIQILDQKQCLFLISQLHWCNKWSMSTLVWIQRQLYFRICKVSWWPLILHLLACLSKVWTFSNIQERISNTAIKTIYSFLRLGPQNTRY